jgi:hypothetical protein
MLIVQFGEDPKERGTLHSAKTVKLCKNGSFCAHGQIFQRRTLKENMAGVFSL